MKIFDWVIIVISLMVVGLSFFTTLHALEGATQVRITAESGTFVYSLNKDKTITISGPLGMTHIFIRDQRVWVKDSPCPNGICMAQGKVQNPGEWIACLPNRVFIIITGENQQIDAITYTKTK